MNKNSNNENQWQPCESGQIRFAGDSIRQKRQLESRRIFLRRASAAVVTVGVGFAGWTLLGPKGPSVETPTFKGTPSPYGGIACRSVVRLLPEYIAQTINDAGQLESIEEHLAKCAPCRRSYDSLANLS